MTIVRFPVVDPSWDLYPESSLIWARRQGPIGGFQFKRCRKPITVATVALACLVAAPAASAMTNDSPPTVSGSATWGSALTSTTGSWSPLIPGSTIAYERQWLRCEDATIISCSAIPGATSVHYTLVHSDVGKRIRVEVTASAGALDSASAVSDPTAVIVENPPDNHGPPTFSGDAEQGSLLVRASYGTWSSPTPTAYTLQWLRCNSAGGACAAIAGATDDNYGIAAADVGHRIRLRVRASGPYGTSEAVSGASAVVVKPTNTPPPGVTPKKRRRAKRLSPFPRIVVAGALSPAGAFFRRVIVKGPRNVTVRVRCRGRGCPYRHRSYRMRRRKLRLRSLERNFRSGAVIELRVVKRGRVGKYTRIRIRRSHVPNRVDRCLNPGSSRPRKCR